MDSDLLDINNLQLLTDAGTPISVAEFGAQVQKSIDHQDETITMMELEMQQLQIDLQEAQSTAAEQQLRADTIEQEFTDELDEARFKIEKLEDNNGEMKLLIGNLKSQQNLRTQEQEYVKQELRHTRVRLEANHRRMTIEQSHNEEYQTSVERLEQVTSEYRSMNESLLAKINKQSAEMNKSKDKIAEMKTTNAELKMRNNALESEITVLSQTIEAIATEAEEEQQEQVINEAEEMEYLSSDDEDKDKDKPKKQKKRRGHHGAQKTIFITSTMPKTPGPGTHSRFSSISSNPFGDVKPILVLGNSSNAKSSNNILGYDTQSRRVSITYDQIPWQAAFEDNATHEREKMRAELELEIEDDIKEDLTTLWQFRIKQESLESQMREHKSKQKYEQRLGELRDRVTELSTKLRKAQSSYIMDGNSGDESKSLIGRSRRGRRREARSAAEDEGCVMCNIRLW